MNKDLEKLLKTLPTRPAAATAVVAGTTDGVIIIQTPDGHNVVLTRDLARKLAAEITDMPDIPVIQRPKEYLN